jgi:hypothetical protein
LHCLEIEFELLDPLAIELDGFFYPGDVRAQLIVATLHLVEGFAAVCVLLSTRFNFRVQSLLESSAALIGDFELLNVGLVLGELELECAKSERVKTCSETGLFSLEPTCRFDRWEKIEINLTTTLVFQIVLTLFNCILGVYSTVLHDPITSYHKHIINPTTML